MSEGPREYSLNYDAANELEEQVRRARKILERLAAHLAATQPQREPDFKDLVEREHVRKAAEFLLGTITPPNVESTPLSRHVFVSSSHEDEAFVTELTQKLTTAGITYFKADRDI